MPAITVDDLTVLPRITSHDPSATTRPVVSLTTAPRGFEGEGFPVHRAFAGVELSLLDPFVMMAEMGEVDYAPGEPKGTPWHPHRGFERLPTSSTESLTTKTIKVVAARLQMATRNG